MPLVVVIAFGHYCLSWSICISVSLSKRFSTTSYVSHANFRFWSAIGGKIEVVEVGVNGGEGMIC